MDVREELGTVVEETAPRGVPIGRWPSEPEFPLALNQQLAVNRTTQMLYAGAGIFAVNGPPGTGKTTMLRDLVAALVVERARRLAELADPRDAFAGYEHWMTGLRDRTVARWQPQLTGFEMVVASANNGAVENVTNEIPAQDAIAEQWPEPAAHVDYFPDIASALLAVDLDDPDETTDDDRHRTREPLAAWALVSARLGNKRNRSRFVDAFWYRKPDEVSPPPDGGERQPPAAERIDESGRGLLEILKQYKQAAAPPCSWAEATAEFRRALDRAASIQADRHRTYDNVGRMKQAERELQNAKESYDVAQQHLDVARTRLMHAVWTVQTSRAERKRCVERRLEHRQFRPGVLEWLTTLGNAMRDWRRDDNELAAKEAAADAALGAAHDERARLERELTRAGRAAAHRAEAVRRLDRDRNEIQATLDQAHATLGDRFPDATWWTNTRRRELAALWTDADWNRARTEVFLAALQLHKSFLQHVPTEMRQSLQAAADIVAGDAPADLPEPAALAAWQALFFVVPVVSTTFASFARLFSHLRREALGWLFIDEAGQATPQNAIGALWRCQRGVIVGDPLQLEPIAPLPFRAEQAIRGGHGVDEQWLSSRTSVQRLADRLNQLGTWLPGADGRIWVGAPLTVHRRCDQPMFGISNHIAYDDLMIHATSPRLADGFRERYPSKQLPESKWIDVESRDAQGHWIPAEGEQLHRVLVTLAGLDFDMSEVMVIAPFRDVANRVRGWATHYPGLVAGTIHTAQGKQAEIVILVLGSDPHRDGARRWAAEKPNLLNVAVSRAKRRLYVIGDRQTWGNHGPFCVLADRLPRSDRR